MTGIGPARGLSAFSSSLGNPPFGHQGEAAIGRWFDQRKEWIFTNHDKGARELPTAIPDDLHAELLKFDGNPQTLRLITKLQTNIAHLGLDLTSATLATAIKYPVGAANRDKKNPVAKKYGFSKWNERLWENCAKRSGWAKGSAAFGLK